MKLQVKYEASFMMLLSILDSNNNVDNIHFEDSTDCRNYSHVRKLDRNFGQVFKLWSPISLWMTKYLTRGYCSICYPQTFKQFHLTSVSFQNTYSGKQEIIKASINLSRVTNHEQLIYTNLQKTALVLQNSSFSWPLIRRCCMSSVAAVVVFLMMITL